MIRARRALAGAVLLVAATAVGIAVGIAVVEPGPSPSTTAAQEQAATTAQVERGTLSTAVSLSGTLTYRARPDGSPYPVIGQARGTFTRLPDVGAEVGCGDELHRVDDRPVLLLCGAIPAYRDLRAGDVGNDVRQLNANLHALGYDAAVNVEIDPGDTAFTEMTAQALAKLQLDRGADPTGELRIDGATVAPEPVRIAAVTAELGGAAQPGAPVVDATSDVLEVLVALVGSQQREVEVGDRVAITLPDNTSVTGRVDRIGAIAQDPDRQNANAEPSGATIAASIGVDDVDQVRGLDRAPVRAEIATHGVIDVLSVPVTAIVGRAGGGYAVEVVRDGGGRELATVELGLFDATAGRVQVGGDVREGDHVVVPSS